jgi:hypothetical protein
LKSSAFTKGEKMMQLISGMAITMFLFVKIGFHYGVIASLITETPTPLNSVWGHGPKCVNICFWTFIGCSLGSSVVKYIFYVIVGKIYGMVPLTAMDDFWVYDYPINPINVPACLVFGKPKDKSPE